MSAITISPINTTFFNLGLSGTKKIGNNIYLRANPNFLIGANKSFRFNINATKEVTQTFRTASTIIQLPVAIKFHSDRYNGFKYADFMRHYLIVGGKLDFDLSGVKGGIIKPYGAIDPRSDLRILKSTDFGAEIGVGLSFYFRYATISPEVKFSYGLRNLKKASTTPLLSNIDKVGSNFIYFTIHIEN
jgi:hypothetical protein